MLYFVQFLHFKLKKNQGYQTFLDGQFENLCFILFLMVFSLLAYGIARHHSTLITRETYVDCRCTISFCKHLKNCTIDVQFIIFSRRWQKYAGREYWTIYRGPRFLALVWFVSSLTPSLSPVSKLSLFFSLHIWVACRAYWWERGVGGGGGPKSYDSKKAWSSINHSILSACRHTEHKWGHVHQFLVRKKNNLANLTQQNPHRGVSFLLFRIPPLREWQLGKRQTI
jgi:hypothetical protein